jgi:cytochrome c553
MHSHDIRRDMLLTVLALLACSTSPGLAQDKLPADHAERMIEGTSLFKSSVRKILNDRCLNCHGGEKTRGDFDLSSREALLYGAGGTKVVALYDHAQSKLFRVISHQDKPFMPHKADKLPDGEIKQLARWIDLGAPYDSPLLVKAKEKGPMVVTDKDRQYWAFQPLSKPALPIVRDTAWCRTDLDRFILAGLERNGMAPAPALDKRRLIRRVYFDLIGLPPAPAEVEAFVRDQDSAAYGKLVDRLLGDIHFGEKWARHWLDLARFAESSGYEHDYDRPFAYHYRDFVIKAFNQDLPFDTFVRWQLAGDEYEPDNSLAVMATGFLAAGTHSTQITKNLVEKERYEQLDDKLRTLGTAMLGLTIGCARCHDHKYDPIPTKDYYRLLSVFTTTVKANVDINLDPESYRKAKAEWDRNLDAPAPKAKLVKALIASEGVPPLRMHTQGADFFEQTYFLKRGDADQKEGVATPSYLQVLMRSADADKHWLVQPPKGWRTSYRRRSLAEWMTDPECGAGNLLARVIVNRLWQQHLGRGVVATPSDFGVQGDSPSHPELLDHLAGELIRGGWRLKAIHKLIVTSAAYLQDGTPSAKNMEVDPENRLVWHRPRQRLQAELIRDAMLSVSGLLDERPFGPGSLDPNHKRRSLYFFVKRSKLVPSLVLFDAPDGLNGVDRRPVTTVAPQALWIMNAKTVRAYAEAFAGRLGPATAANADAMVEQAYSIALGRPPSAKERHASVEFIRGQTADYTAAGRAEPVLAAVADFCQVVLGLNEFIYID